MSGITWEDFKKKRLHEVWDALPDGYRLRIAVFDSEGLHFSGPLSPARMLAYFNRIVVGIRQEGKEIFCAISITDGCEMRKRYRIDGWW